MNSSNPLSPYSLSPYPLSPWIHRLAGLCSKPHRIIAGAMSGTSVDGLDVGICKVSDTRTKATVELLKLYTFPYPSELQRRVRALATSSTLIQEVSDLHLLIGQFFGDSIRSAIDQFAQAGGEPVELVGSHGQTVYHHSRKPGLAVRSTYQLGCGDQIAERSQLPTIFNFRARDIAGGGEGAPLTPYSDAVMFQVRDESKAVLNLGGIANISLLSPDPARLFGFDCGPANAPLDRLARRISNGAQHADVDGARARAGTVNSKALQQLIAEDAFLSLPPPKSTGFEMYGDSFVDRLISLHGLPAGAAPTNDCLATATEFVARGIAQAVALSGRPVQELIVAGGGMQNTFLIERLQACLGSGIIVVSAAQYGVPPQAREVMAFALFANEFLFGTTVSHQAITGVDGSRVLGTLALGR